MKMCYKFLIVVVLLMNGLGASQAQSALKGHDTQQPIDVSSDDSELRPNDGWALLSGLVRVKQGDLLMTADKMRIFFDKNSLSSNPVILRLDALGRIKFTSPSEKISGDRAVYDVEKRLLTMIGNIDVQRGNSRLKGARLEIDLVSGITKLDGQTGLDNNGRVKGVFSLPKSKSKSDQK